MGGFLWRGKYNNKVRWWGLYPLRYVRLRLQAMGTGQWPVASVFRALRSDWLMSK